MKRDWELQELIEEWTLVPRELELLGNKTGSTRLGYAVLLKFFQREGRFPDTRAEIPKAVLRYLSRQVNIEPEHFRHYDWHSRSATYHRRQIREFCGFRSPTAQDARDLKDWLRLSILPQSQDLPFLEQSANQRLRELGIEGLGNKHLERIVRSALHQHEREFCQSIVTKLSAQTCQDLDQLLRTTINSAVSKLGDCDGTVPMAGLPFQSLSAEPAGAGLSHLFQEAEKLQLVRQLNLPSDLFSGVSTQLVTRYQWRAATERQVELRAPIRKHQTDDCGGTARGEMGLSRR